MDIRYLHTPSPAATSSVGFPARRVHAAEGMKVWEAMQGDLKFDIQKFYKNVDMGSGWLVSFGTSIFKQWEAGKLNGGLSYKQRGVIDRELRKHPQGGKSLWDELHGEFSARSATKFASADYSYGR